MSVIGLSPSSWIWKGKWWGKLKEKVEQIALELYIYSLYSDWQIEDFSETKSKVSEKPECWGKKKRYKMKRKVNRWKLNQPFSGLICNELGSHSNPQKKRAKEGENQ